MTTTNTTTADADAAPMLPGWPDNVRAMPNGILRSALFGAGQRRYMKGERLASIKGVDLLYTGESLDQGDLDVYMSVLHTLQTKLLGSDCHVTGSVLLDALGLTDTGKNRGALKERITRLVACAVELRHERYTYIGSLISGAVQDEQTRAWVITLNPDLQQLFEADQYTQIDWEARRALAGRPLAKWLHGFYSTHADPLKYKQETLLDLAGSQDVNPRSANRTLRKALTAIAAEANGEEFSYTITDGLVGVSRRPSESQARHLIKKVRK